MNIEVGRLARDLLGHLADATAAFLVRLVVLLEPEQLVGRLLRKQLNGYPLVVHGDF